MSSNLYWRPFRHGEKPLPDELKFVLRKSDYEHNGINVTLTESDMPYFQALKDADIKGADKIVEALEKYGEIEISEVF